MTNLLFSANSRFRTNASSRVQPRSHGGSRGGKQTVLTNFTPYEMAKGEEYMSAEMLQHFKDLLLQWKQELMEEVDRTMHHMQEDAANYADPSDRATQEEEFSLELRTRDRERKLIKKIDQTIDRIDKDDYGFCDQCGVEIGIRRLEARPTATLCIDCKTLAEIRAWKTSTPCGSLRKLPDRSSPVSKPTACSPMNQSGFSPGGTAPTRPPLPG